MNRIGRLPLRDDSGSVFLLGLVMVGVMMLLGIALFDISTFESRLVGVDVDSAQAFHCAEAGLAQAISNNQTAITIQTAPAVTFDSLALTTGNGAYSASAVSTIIPTIDGPNRFLTSTCTSPSGVTRTIRATLNFLAPFFEYAAGAGGGDLFLRGTDAPNFSGSGGADVINGDVYVKGNVFLNEQAQVNPFSTSDDRATISVVTGFSVNDNSSAFPRAGDLDPTATVSDGDIPHPNVTQYVTDVLAAPAAILNSGGNVRLTGSFQGNTVYYLKEIFNVLGTNSDQSLRLPTCNPCPERAVYDQLQAFGIKKNPGNSGGQSRAAEDAATVGDDYYFDGRNVGEVFSSPKRGERGAQRRIDLGSTPPVFMVDGHLRFHATDAFGFAIDGRATFVTTQDVIISDNLIYLNGNAETRLDRADLIGIVAQRDIWFGDPRFGTFAEGSGVMLAGRDFNFMFFKQDGTCCRTPENAVTLNGTMLAERQIKMFRDWADPNNSKGSCSPGSTNCKPVAFFPDDTTCKAASGCWRLLKIDASGEVVKDTSLAGFADGARLVTHYQMTINYETRLQTNPELVPPGLPTGRGRILGSPALIAWHECANPSCS
jgi:hypothetical protein